MEKLLAAESTECRTVHNGLVDDGDAFRSEMQLKGVGLAVRTGLGGKAHPIFQAHRGFTESISPVPADIDVHGVHVGENAAVESRISGSSIASGVEVFIMPQM